MLRHGTKAGKWLGWLVPLGALAWILYVSRPGEPVLEYVPTTTVDESQCAECHAGVVAEFQSTPHFNTLERADQDTVLLKSLAEAPAGWSPDGVYRWLFRNGQFQVSHPAHAPASPIPVDWRFGSGRRSRAYVSLLRDHAGRVEMLEQRWSWYADGDQWDLTFGHPARPGTGLESMGVVHSFPSALQCFGCHATQVPVRESALVADRIVPNIRCERCHAGAAEHDQQMRSGKTMSRMERWSELGPTETVNRCGECHRRADQLAEDELVESNVMLVRFAGAALPQSRCFQESLARRPLTCLTCHDPHRPADTDPATYSARCRDCHSGRPSEGPLCSGEPGATLCLDCHMPAREIAPHLRFTDHWIRVRR